jgi:hypothetical protein
MTLVMYACSLWFSFFASDAKVATQQGSTAQSGSVSQSSLLLLELVVLFQGVAVGISGHCCVQILATDNSCPQGFPPVQRLSSWPLLLLSFSLMLVMQHIGRVVSRFATLCLIMNVTWSGNA